MDETLSDDELDYLVIAYANNYLNCGSFPESTGDRNIDPIVLRLIELGYLRLEIKDKRMCTLRSSVPPITEYLITYLARPSSLTLLLFHEISLSSLISSFARCSEGMSSWDRKSVRSVINTTRCVELANTVILLRADLSELPAALTSLSPSIRESAFKRLTFLRSKLGYKEYDDL